MSLAITMTEQIIAQSEPQDCNECAVAQALRDTFKEYYDVVNVTVYQHDSEVTIYNKITNLLHTYNFENSKEIADFIEHFDTEAHFDEYTGSIILDDFKDFDIFFNVKSKSASKLKEDTNTTIDPRELLNYSNRSFISESESPKQSFLIDTFNQAQDSLKEFDEEGSLKTNQHE